MDISKHIENLKEYIKIDKQNIEYIGDFGEFCKKHIEDIEAILKENQRLNKMVEIMAQNLTTLAVVSSKMIKEPLQEYFDNEMIKSIVTKEMFNSVEYKLEEENGNNKLF